MQEIHSGTTTERIVRTTLLVALFGGFSIAFLRDGYGAYARENVTDFLQTNNIQLPTTPEPDPAITSTYLAEVAKSFPINQSLESLTTKLGQPHAQTSSGDHAYWFGPGIRVDATVVNGRVEKLEDQRPMHSEADIFLQKVLGGLLAALTLVFAVHLVRVLLTRADLTDAGLKLRGGPQIPFEAMRRFRADEYMCKGWLDLEYELNGQPGSVRLDNYHIKHFRPLINAICDRTGFANPLPPPSAT